MSPANKVITYIKNFYELKNILQSSPGLVVVMFGAEWCEPCKKINSVVYKWFSNSTIHIQCCYIDIDECRELFNYLNTKKIIFSLPSILCWVRGNESYSPDDMVNEGDPEKVTEFFNRCMEKLSKK